MKAIGLPGVPPVLDLHPFVIPAGHDVDNVARFGHVGGLLDRLPRLGRSARVVIVGNRIALVHEVTSLRAASLR